MTTISKIMLRGLLHNRVVLAFVMGIAVGVVSTNLVSINRRMLAEWSCRHEYDQQREMALMLMPLSVMQTTASQRQQSGINFTTTAREAATRKNHVDEHQQEEEEAMMKRKPRLILVRKQTLEDVNSAVGAVADATQQQHQDRQETDLNSTAVASAAAAQQYLDQFHHDIEELKKTWPFTAENYKRARIYVIHCGKTGGATINQRLLILRMMKRFLKCRMHMNLEKDPCYERFLGASKRAKEARLTHRAYGHMHLKDPTEPSRAAWLAQYTNILLWNIRDPVDRLVSAFNYHRWKVVERPSELRTKPGAFDARTVRFFEECFPTVQHLAETIDPRQQKPQGSGDHAMSDGSTCHDWGLNVVTGELILPHMEHIVHNYQFYYKQAWNDTKTIAVVRAENLWGDVARLEGMLGGNPFRFWNQTLRVSHGSESYAVKSKVDEHGAMALCCVLVGELTVYHTLVVAAQNLKQSEKRETLLATLKKCGVTSVHVDFDQRDGGLVWSELANWKWNEWHQKTCHP